MYSKQEVVFPQASPILRRKGNLMHLRKVPVFGLAIVAVLLCLHVSAWAVPKLQLYIPGATYDTDTETWVYPGLEYELWAIGAANEQGITIEDVKLAAAVKSDQTGSIAITPLGGMTSLTGTFFEDSIPVKGDGKELPRHGIYPSDFYEFPLGDFILTETGIPDFTQGYDPQNPVPTNNYGLIQKFYVTVTGGYDWVHFDLYNHIEGENKALFAPFSHDADAEDGGGGGTNPIPEPATILLVGFGIAGLGGTFRKRFLK